MLKPWQFKLLTALGALSLLLILTNGTLFTQNRAAQTEANSRQQYVQQSVALEGLYREMVKALAELAVKNNDGQLRQMLASQGINISVSPLAPAPAPAPATPAPSQAAGPKR